MADITNVTKSNINLEYKSVNYRQTTIPKLLTNITYTLNISKTEVRYSQGGEVTRSLTLLHRKVKPIRRSRIPGNING